MDWEVGSGTQNLRQFMSRKLIEIGFFDEYCRSENKANWQNKNLKLDSVTTIAHQTQIFGMGVTLQTCAILQQYLLHGPVTCIHDFLDKRNNFREENVFQIRILG